MTALLSAGRPRPSTTKCTWMGSNLFMGPIFEPKGPYKRQHKKNVDQMSPHFQGWSGVCMCKSGDWGMRPTNGCLHPSACSALSIIGTDIDIAEFWLADWHWKALTQTSMLKISILTVVKNTPNLLLNMAPILLMFVKKMEYPWDFFIFGEKSLKGMY